MRITYKGADTDDTYVPLRSDGANPPPLPAQSAWLMRMFESDSQLTTMPNVNVLKFLGAADVPAIDFHNMDQLQQVCLS